MRCYKCRHFEPFSQPFQIGYQFNSATSKKTEKLVIGWGVCTSPKVREGDDRDLENHELPLPGQDEAFAYCDEYRGSLCVGPYFGCIHWESK